MGQRVAHGAASRRVRSVRQSRGSRPYLRLHNADRVGSRLPAVSLSMPAPSMTARANAQKSTKNLCNVSAAGDSGAGIGAGGDDESERSEPEADEEVFLAIVPSCAAAITSDQSLRGAVVAEIAKIVHRGGER